MAELTEREFSKHVNTKFLVQFEGQPSVELDLARVKNYAAGDHEEQSMERFSAFFRGPKQPYLQQGTYNLQHEQMGEFPIFLVPVGQTPNGFDYEAVFNYYKTE